MVYKGLQRRMKFSANYEFIKTRKVNCGNLHFNSSTGRVSNSIWRIANINNNLLGIIQRHAGSNTESSVAVHEECEWTIEPPPHRVMKIKVNMADIRDGE